MNEDIDVDRVISGIMKKYPENEWLVRCRAALPGIDDISIMEGIEVLNGGDVRVVEEDGTEHGLFVP